MGIILHWIKVVVYKYEKRIVMLLSRIAECCGGIDHDGSVCTACKVRIIKCSKLVARGQMALSYYVALIRDVMAER